MPTADTPGRIAYLGPAGTFSEEALLTQPDLAASELIDHSSIPDVIDAVANGDVDLALVPLENAIDGAVTTTLDQLAFEVELLIQREVVINVRMNLIAASGTALADVERVVSIPIATAQCHTFLRAELPKATLVAATSTAEAARALAEEPERGTAVIGPGRAAEVYGLDVLAADIEDHPENQTRFGLLARDGVPAPTGHDKTAIVVFQAADQPGSLLSILQEFAARSINLTNLQSRPTKRGLGDYCFLIDLEGHIADDVVADCLRELKCKQGGVKFLGSFPAAGEAGEVVRRDAEASWRAADAWLQGLRAQVPPGR